MHPTAILDDLVGRIRESMRAAVEGLDAEQLAHRPSPTANPIGWLCWHTARIQDEHVAAVGGLDQRYTAGGWADRLGLPADGADIGYGHSPEEVAARCPTDAEALLGYLDAVCDQTAAYLRTVDEDDLQRVVDERWDPPVTLAVRLASVVNDNLQHTGQAAYVRGLLEDAA